jgi:hypothetical protein
MFNFPDGFVMVRAEVSFPGTALTVTSSSPRE